MNDLDYVNAIGEVGDYLGEIVCERSPEAAILAAEIAYVTLVEQFVSDDAAAARRLEDTRAAIRNLLKDEAQGASVADVAAWLLLS